MILLLPQIKHLKSLLGLELVQNFQVIKLLVKNMDIKILKVILHG